MNRRGFLTGVAGLLAAPAIVRVSSLMPVSVIAEVPSGACLASTDWLPYHIAYDPGAGEEMAIVWRVVDTYSPKEPTLFWGAIPEAAYAS